MTALPFLLQTAPQDWTAIAALAATFFSIFSYFLYHLRTTRIQEKQVETTRQLSAHDQTIRGLVEYAKLLEKYEKGFRVFYRVLRDNNLLDDPDVRALNGLVVELEKQDKKKDEKKG